jgi:hypothetical protein
MIDYTAFKDCPSLRRFSVAEYTWDVHRVIASVPDPAATRQLALSCGDMWTTGQEPAALLRPHPDYPSLPLRLRAVDINLRRGRDLHLTDGDGNYVEKIPSAEAVMADLVAVDDGTLEALTVWVDDTHWFDDTDGYDPRFCTPVEVDMINNMDILLAALPKLRNLTQLAVELARLDDPTLPPSYRYDYFDPSMRPFEDFVTLATKLANAGPRLRYIDLRAISYLVRWRVWHSEDGAVELELLWSHGAEAEEVEIFWEPAGGRRHLGEQGDLGWGFAPSLDTWEFDPS